MILLILSILLILTVYIPLLFGGGLNNLLYYIVKFNLTEIDWHSRLAPLKSGSIEIPTIDG